MSWIPAPEAHVEAGSLREGLGIGDQFSLASAAMTGGARLADGQEVGADLQLVDPADAAARRDQNVEQAVGLFDQGGEVAVAAALGRLERGVLVLGGDRAAGQQGEEQGSKVAHLHGSNDMWLEDYIGLPFLAKGRTRAGLDCWGLVRLVLLECCGVALPLWVEGYENIEPNPRTAAWLRECAGSFTPVTEARPGDILLFRIGGDLAHVGLDIGAGRMLHIHEGINACIERWRGPRWLPRLEGIYRHG